MEKLKKAVTLHFETILVLIIIAAIASIIYLIPYKLGFLNFFYLPVIAAGYYLGKHKAVMTALLCILLVLIFVLLLPAGYFSLEVDPIYIYATLSAWASFLILTSAAIGYLYEEKERRIKDLKAAYIGILEILMKYLDSADKYTKGHSVRVAQISAEIASEMGFSAKEKENIRAAGLLHDIGKIEISMDVLKKAASLTANEKEQMSAHTEKGARLISLVGSVLEDAIPIVLAHHKYYFEDKAFSRGDGISIPIGAAIIAVADAYDAMITDRPYRNGRPPWKAFEEIETEAGVQFHPKVVKAFKQVLISSELFPKGDPEP